MALKTRLDPQTMETAVLGGAVLGHGGGGKLEDGLYLGELAAAQGSANEESGEAAVAAVQQTLPCKFSTFATVTHINWQGEGQNAQGTIELRDINNRHLVLTYKHRYLELMENGTKTAAFPDLVITLGTLGTPLSGEEVFIGQDLYLLVATQIE